MDSFLDESFSPPFPLKKKLNAPSSSSKKGVATKLSLHKNDNGKKEEDFPDSPFNPFMINKGSVSITPLHKDNRIKKEVDFADSPFNPFMTIKGVEAKLKQEALTRTPISVTTPLSGRTPLSASFLFNSCKKAAPTKPSAVEKEPAILVYSSDEEQPPSRAPPAFDDDDDDAEESFYAGVAGSPADPVQESLEEYSLIRRWLHRADTSPSDSEVSEGFRTPPPSPPPPVAAKAPPPPFPSPPPAMAEKVVDPPIASDDEVSILPEPPKKVQKDVVVVLSSDEDDQLFEKFLNAAKTPRVQPKIEPEKESAASSFINDSSLTEDSFDSSFVMKSLRQRMNELDTDFDRWLGRKEESGDQGEAKAKADATGRSKPLKGLLSSASQSSDDNDDDESELLKRHKPKTVVRRKKNAPVQVARPSKADDSDLEDVFGGLSIETAPKVARPKPPLGAPTAAGTRPTHRSFLASLSADLGDEQRHPEATFYVGKSFRKRRDELTSRLFGLFNAGVFDGALPADLSVTWNARLTRTAGYCRHWSRRDAADAGAVRFESRIELSVKVVDTPCRLRDTLIHEMCHAATWMIDNCRGGHGPVWRKWAHRSQRAFPELPAITRCHNYEISFKFYYNCTTCRYSIGRHSKSVDTETQVCPVCRGRLQLGTESQSKENEVPRTPASNRTPRAPNAFALFVKEHYASVRAGRPDLPHASVMKILSSKFAETKKSSL